MYIPVETVIFLRMADVHVDGEEVRLADSLKCYMPQHCVCQSKAEWSRVLFPKIFGSSKEQNLKACRLNVCWLLVEVGHHRLRRRHRCLPESGQGLPFDDPRLVESREC